MRRSARRARASPTECTCTRLPVVRFWVSWRRRGTQIGVGPVHFSATRRDARPAARAQRRCSGAARSHNGRLERCATLVSTCTAARSATTTCARPPTQFKARAPSGRCRCAVAALSERARWRRHGQRQDPAPPGQHHGRPCLVLEARRRVPSSTEGTPSVSRRASPVRPPSPCTAACPPAVHEPCRG